jgi:hypothetical protein
MAQAEITGAHPGRLAGVLLMINEYDLRDQ